MEHWPVMPGKSSPYQSLRIRDQWRLPLHPNTKVSDIGRISSCHILLYHAKYRMLQACIMLFSRHVIIKLNDVCVVNNDFSLRMGENFPKIQSEIFKWNYHSFKFLIIYMKFWRKPNKGEHKYTDSRTAEEQQQRNRSCASGTIFSTPEYEP